MVISISGCRSAQHYIERGNQFYEAGKYDDAVISYRNAINKDSQSGEAYYRLSLALVKLSRGVEAYDSLNRAVNLSPQNVPAKVELASMCLAAYARDSRHPAVLYKEARSLTDDLLAKNPNSSDGLRLKGALALVDNRPTEAVEAFQKGLQSSPQSMELHTDLAEALLKDNRLEEGEQAARQAISKYPKYAPPYELLYAFYVGQKRDADAVALLKLWNANDPNESTPVFRLAAYYYRQHQAADAEGMLNTLLQRRASIPRADLMVGDFHLMVRDWDKALADYQRGQSLDKANAALYQQREASTLAAMGRRDDALKAVEAILSKDPKDQFARVLKTQILTRSGGAANLNTATTLATDLAKEAPSNARVQMIAGQTFLAKGDLDSATARFKQATTADPQALNARLALAQIALLRKNYAAALENASAALTIKPDEPTARLLRVVALTGSGSYTEAKQEAEELARGTKDAPPVEMQLGIIALRQKDYAEAQRRFQKLYREGDSNLYPLAGLVSTYLGEHQADHALQLAQAELARAPQSSGKAALLIATAEAAGKHDVALTELQQLAAKNPKSAEVQIQIGEMERRYGDLPSALKAFEHARDLAPQRKGLDATIGSLQDEAGQKTEAIKNYRKALTQNPDDPIILNNLAFLLTETGGDLNEALRLATAASRKSPNSPPIEDTLAWIHIKQGNSAAMLPVLNQLTHKDPSNATFRYHYAVALLQKGDRASAKQQLEAALSDKPAKQTETEIRNTLAQIR